MELFPYTIAALHGLDAPPHAQKVWVVHGFLAHKKHPPPKEPPRSLGIGLLQGPTRGGGFL